MKNERQVFLFGVSILILLSVLFFYVKADYEEKYEITQKEIAGLEDIAELSKVNVLLKITRGISQLNNDDAKYISNIFNITPLNTKTAVMNLNDINILDFYHEIEKNKNNISNLELFNRYTDLIEHLDQKRLNITDSSYLLFEPDREKYFLMVLAALDVHAIKESVGVIRGIGSSLLNEGVDEVKGTILKNQLFLFNKKLKQMQYTISKLTIPQSTALQTKLSSIEYSFNLLNEDVTKIIQNKKINVKEYFVNSTKLIKEINNFFISSKDILQTRLEKREKSLKTKINTGKVLFIVLVLSILAIIYTTYMSILADKEKVKKKRRESRLLDSLIDSFSQNSSLKTICDDSLRQLIDYFQALNGSLYLFEKANNKLYLGSYYGIKKKDLQFTLNLHDNYISESILEKSIKVTNINSEVNLGNVTQKSTKLLTIPLFEFGEPIGSIQLSFDENFKNIDLEFIEKVTSVMTSYINKAQIDNITSNYIKLVDSNVLISKTDLSGTIIEVSEELCSLSQYTKEELIGNMHNILRHPDMSKEFFKTMWKTIKSGNVWKGEIKNRKKDGTHYWVDSIVSPDRDLNGNIIGYTAIRHDITDKKRVEELAITDKLTSLYNRRYFDTVFSNQVEQAKRNNTLLVFVLIDIDHFKQYNDTYGHQEGDETLKQVAKTLKTTINRPNDLVFRLGGEEFGLLYTVADESDALNIANLARQNVEKLKIVHMGNSASKYVTISSGVYIITSGDNATVETIYKLADEALYRAKEEGRNQVVVADI